MFKLVCFLFAPFFFINASGSNSSTSSTICPSYTCGNGLNISYPFWLSQGSPPDQYCGYPEFGLICSDHDPIFSPPPGLYYYIKDIDYKNHSLRLIDFDTANKTCPRALHGVPLGSLPLSHSPLNLNLSFYYNCSSQPSKEPSIGCLRSGLNESFVFVMGNETNGFEWDKNCQQKVVVTVMKHEITGEGLINEFAGAMNKGFVLDWQTASNCNDCEASDGLCGYSNTRKQQLCFCKDGSVRSNNCRGRSKARLLLKLIIGLVTGVIAALLICIILCIYRRKFWKMTKNDQNIEAFIKSHGPLTIKRYTFSDIKKMTHSFEVKLGEGGYGEVYKGIILSGCPVAVKVLNTSKGNGEDFINEVVSISKTSHVNIVSLLGFCLEGQKKALSWERLHQIAKGIARGLEYLHRGCNTRILHFDIKPNNILLDNKFCPKISDFGLAKLCSKTQSVISMLDARGTVGYIAPEVWNRNFGGVSHKSDVYSYGMLILEMVGGKHNINTQVSHTSEMYFPHWVYKHIEMDSNIAGHGAMTAEENEIARKMIVAGLWCIQTIPSDRPPMTKVIEMLEGSLDQLQIPPKPFIFSPTRTEVESSATSGDN